jgi:polyferredoxin
MPWLRDPRRRRFVLFLLLAFIGYLAVYEVVFPLLWPYRDHPMVWFLLAFFSGNHLPELFPGRGMRL